MSTTPQRSRPGRTATVPTPTDARRELFSTVCQRARVYRIAKSTRVVSTGAQGFTPETITLLTPVPDDPSQDQLFINHFPVARHNWSWNEAAKTLTWNQPSPTLPLSGRFRFMCDRTTGFGYIAAGGIRLSAEVNVKPVHYKCDLSANAGVYASGDAAQVQLHWDPNSAAWKNATWVNGALDFAYGIEGQVFIGIPTYTVIASFHDLQTGALWNPPDQAYQVLVSEDMDLSFTLGKGFIPDADPRATLTDPAAQAIDTVYPYEMSVKMDPFASTFQGAMLTDSYSLMGKTYAVRGTVTYPGVVGFYLVDVPKRGQSVVAVHDGRLLIDGTPVPGSRQIGTRLEWSGLPAHLAQKVNLPASGTLEFTPDGSAILPGPTAAGGRRLTYEQPAPAAVSVLPALAAPAAAALSLYDLLNMSQYAQDENGNYYDYIQQEAMDDFYQVLQYYMDKDLRQTFIGPAPTLSADLLAIAKTPGADSADPKAWYQELSIPYLTSALSTWDDPYAKKLNALRAQKWMKETVSAASVYTAQAPAMYARHWAQHYPEINTFISDQQKNKAAYAQIIEGDKADWKSMLTAAVEADEQSMEQLMKMVDDVAAAGENAQYWSYVFFRYATQPSFLNYMCALAVAPAGDTTDGGEFARQVQSNMAVLNVLDPSGFFVSQYVQVMELFSIGNVVPTLLDYSGNLEDFQYACNEILQQFVDTYIDSTDPAMQQAAQEIQDALASGQTREILEAFHSLAGSLAGLVTWEELATRFEQSLPFILNKIPYVTSKLVSLAATAVGMMAFMYGATHWQDLTPEERAELVIGGVGLFAQLTAGMVKRGIAYPTIFRTENTTWEAFKCCFWDRDTMNKAEQRVQNGFAKWLLNEGKLDLEGMETEVVFRFFSRASEEDFALTSRLFGKNLDEFVATRIGSVLALANLFMCAWDLAKHHDDKLEIASDSFFIASASLELFARAGKWALDAARVVKIGAYAVSSICTVISAVAAVAAIVGVVLTLVSLFVHKPTPVEDFAKNEARKKGFYMPDGADIESLQVYQASDTSLQKVGVTLTASDQKDTCLVMNADGHLSTGKQANSYSTAFFLTADAEGRAQISTLVTKGSDQILVVLTGDQGAASAQEPLTEDPNSTQLWQTAVQDHVQWDGANVQAANFQLYHEIGGKKYYLRCEQGLVKIGTSAYEWKLSMEPMSPGMLAMQPVVLYEYQHDEQFSACLAQAGSQPKSWSISPALPAFLDFDPKSGRLFQKPGIAPPLQAVQSYNISVKNDLGTVSAPFTIQVLAAPAPC